MAPSSRDLPPAGLLSLLSALAIGLLPGAASADSSEAWCVFSRHDHTMAIQQGPCSWSQRQGNVDIRFRFWAFRFPADENGRTYARLEREGAEAGPVFSREGQYTLSVFWRKPAREPGGR